MPDDALPMVHAKSTSEQLRRVADALGVPAASFLGQGLGDLQLAGATELLGLWAKLRHQDDRDALLVKARDLVSRYDVESAAAG